MKNSGHWHDLAEQASQEMNGARLTLLVTQLCAAIDAERESKPLSVTDFRVPVNDPAVLAGD